MTLRQLANEASTTTTGAISAAATTLPVTSATGFPTVAPFKIRVSGALTAGGNGIEYMTVTAGAGTTSWTITRADEVPFNTALGFATGATVEQVFTRNELWLAGAQFDIRSFGDPNATDKTAAIIAAHDAAVAHGGGTVLLPPETIMVSGNLPLSSRVAYKGQGVQKTIVKLINTSNPLAVFVGANFATLVDGETGGGILQFTLQDFTIDGNKANQTAVLRSRPITPTSSTATTGGTLAASTYSYRIVARNALGRTLSSDYVFQTTTGATSTVTVNWTAVSGATNYRIYGRTYPGTFITEVGAVTTWTDTGSITPGSETSPKHNSSASAGVKFYGYDYVVDNVIIKNCPGEGFFSRWGNLESDGATDTTNWDYMEAMITRMKVHDNGADGFIFDGPHDTYIMNVFSFFNGNSAWSRNFDLRGNGFSSSLVNCHAYGDAQYAIATGGNYQLQSCVGEGASEAQLIAIGDDLRVWGGQYFAGGAAFPAADGIVIGTGAYSPKNTLVWGPALNGFQKPGAAFDFTFAGLNTRVFAMVDQAPPTTTLSAAETSSDTTLGVASGTNFANGDSFWVDNEKMTITAGGGTTSFTVTRGQGGTIAAAHLIGATVTRHDPPYLGVLDEGADVDLFITGTAQKIAGGSLRQFESNATLRGSLAFKGNATPPVPPSSGYLALYSKTDSQIYTQDNVGAESVIGPAKETFPFSYNGALTVRTGSLRLPLDANFTFVSARASVGTAPTGAALIADINKNGTTIFGTQANRPTIAVSTNAAVAGAPTVTTFVAGDYLTIDIDQIGSTVAGSDLVVSVVLRRTS